MVPDFSDKGRLLAGSLDRIDYLQIVLSRTVCLELVQSRIDYVQIVQLTI